MSGRSSSVWHVQTLETLRRTNGRQRRLPACQECKRARVKCEKGPIGLPCTRCQLRGNVCSLVTEGQSVRESSRSSGDNAGSPEPTEFVPDGSRRVRRDIVVGRSNDRRDEEVGHGNEERRASLGITQIGQEANSSQLSKHSNSWTSQDSPDDAASNEPFESDITDQYDVDFEDVERTLTNDSEQSQSNPEIEIAGDDPNEPENASNQQSQPAIKQRKFICTLFHLFVTFVILGIGIPKVVASFQGEQVTANMLDLIIGIPVALLSLWLGVMKEQGKGAQLKWFLHDDFRDVRMPASLRSWKAAFQDRYRSLLGLFRLF